MPLTVRKRGRYFYARGTVPFRQADGKIAKVRIEESTGETSRARALRFAETLWDYYRDQAYKPQPKSISFTDAALTYVKTKNPSKRDRQFLQKLVAHFGETPISEIDQAAAAEAAQCLYPNTKGSTHVRAVFAPITTVLRLAGVARKFERPRIMRSPIAVPMDDWFDRILQVAPQQLNALVVFLTLTGRRITEALEAIDNGDGTVTIGRTKTGGAVSVRVPDLCRSLLPNLGKRSGDKVWSFGDRHNVYRELRKVCKRAGVPYYGTHALGRHAFATRLLKKGFSTKFVADAGGWASTRMVETTYGHLAKSEVQQQVQAVGDAWGKRLAKRQKTGEK